jgi:tRNA (mo5U34)-methyltransferase
MNRNFPSEPQEFLRAGNNFRTRVQSIKAEVTVPDYGWYPYEPLSALSLITELITPVYGDIVEACLANPVADLGCADGDLGMLFADLGAEVDAIDHRESNFNQMRGVEVLRRALGSAARGYDVDLDSRFGLPHADYGLALFLGTLYHLKNPFYVLEKLAAAADWCVVSTRIAQVTPGAKARIEAEPVAYLLAPREVNNDPTNFWIFSATGLSRLLERTGWVPISERRIGCLANSDPVDPQADERAFVLVKSRVRHPELQVHRLDGWHSAENDAWCWTAKQFAVQVTLPESEHASEFALRFTVPDVVVSGGKKIHITCHIGEVLAGSISCDAPDTIEFRGRFPDTASPGKTLRLDFSVASAFEASPPDRRQLGIIVPLLHPSHRGTGQIPFRIS